jgi:hypothetical protein
VFRTTPRMALILGGSGQAIRCGRIIFSEQYTALRVWLNKLLAVSPVTPNSFDTVRIPKLPPLYGAAQNNKKQEEHLVSTKRPCAHAWPQLNCRVRVNRMRITLKRLLDRRGTIQQERVKLFRIFATYSTKDIRVVVVPSRFVVTDVGCSLAGRFDTAQRNTTTGAFNNLKQRRNIWS